ncbi:DUF1775 domain-containing protein [Candidatus Saccharibacteria bacterium]|nr:DUF1775 domain-containing protein [Candidatus Saccharibacteria bacterium]
MYRRMLIASLLVMVALLPATASAHVVVTPAQADVASELVFSTSVPNEKQVAVTGLRLVVPGGLKEVSPTVKPGWTIITQSSGNTITEIDWMGGSIPVGQRDDFSFGAQVPATPTTLNWKAYQMYADGSVTAWDQIPNGSGNDSFTPYSTTSVVDDLTTGASTAATSTKTDAALALSVVALILALAGLIPKRSR